MKKLILVLICVFALSNNAKAQDGIENILFADLADANKLTEAFLSPAARGFTYGMNNGWYHTAKVHSLFGFDITIGGNVSLVPKESEKFDVNSLNLSNKITQNPSTTPTVLGEDNAVTNAFEVTIPANSDPNINNGVHPELRRNFTMPNGYKNDLPLNGVPTPAVQISMGLPWQLEASLRFLPEVGNDETKGKLLGLGLKKEITSWFGPIEKLPLHVSILGAFTTMNVTSIIDDPSGNDINITNGLAELKLNSYTIQAIASLNFPIINVYGGFGYVSGNSTLKLGGRYELQYSDGLVNYTRTLNDPLNLNYDVSGMRATLGARLSLGFFKVFGSYTLQEFNTANLGVAFSFR